MKMNYIFKNIRIIYILYLQLINKQFTLKISICDILCLFLPFYPTFEANNLIETMVSSYALKIRDTGKGTGINIIFLFVSQCPVPSAIGENILKGHDPGLVHVNPPPIGNGVQPDGETFASTCRKPAAPFGTLNSAWSTSKYLPGTGVLNSKTAAEPGGTYTVSSFFTKVLGLPV